VIPYLTAKRYAQFFFLFKNPISKEDVKCFGLIFKKKSLACLTTKEFQDLNNDVHDIFSWCFLICHLMQSNV